MTRRKMNDGYYMPRLYDFLGRLRDNNYRDLFPGISTTADWGCTLQCGPFVR